MSTLNNLKTDYYIVLNCTLITSCFETYLLLQSLKILSTNIDLMLRNYPVKMASSGKRTCTPQQMEDVQGDNRWMDMVRSLSGIDTVVFVICLMSMYGLRIA